VYGFTLEETGNGGGTGVPDYMGGGGGTGGEIEVQSFVAGGLLEGNQTQSFVAPTFPQVPIPSLTPVSYAHHLAGYQQQCALPHGAFPVAQPWH